MTQGDTVTNWPYDGHPGCDFCERVVAWCKELEAKGIEFRVLLSEVAVRCEVELPDIVGACPP